MIKQKFKILLTTPLFEQSFYKKTVSLGSWINNFSYGFASLSAVAKELGAEVYFFDAQLAKDQEAEFVACLKKHNFDLIGLTIYSMTVNKVFATVRLAKQVLPQAKIVIGGAHVTSLPQETMMLSRDIDFAIIGEGEGTFCELIETLGQSSNKLNQIAGLAFRDNGVITVNRPRPIIEDIDSLPMVDYTLFPLRRYMISPNIVKRYPTYCLQISRGCPYNCAFCEYTKASGKKFRTRSLTNIIKEIRYLQENYGARGLVFRDSTLTLSKAWMESFCERLIKEKINLPWMCYSRTDAISRHPELLPLMKQAGCWQIGFGCESANQKSLDLLNKGTTVQQNIDAVKSTLKQGINVSTTWIICLPGETEEDAMKTIDLACTLGGHVAKFFLPIPYPKTKLYDLCLEDGGCNKDFSWDDYEMLFPEKPIYVNPRIGQARMQYLLKYAYRKFYSRPKVIWNVLRDISSVDSIKKYFCAGKTLLNIR